LIFDLDPTIKNGPARLVPSM